MDVSIEVGSKRVFACAIAWPGYARAARDEASALDALLAYGPRYRKAVAKARAGFSPPSSLAVVERHSGNASTDFGVPGIPPRVDADPIGGAELKRQLRILRACWGAVDDAAVRARGIALRKGPRGGGRTLAKIVDHVTDAEKSYLSAVGGSAQGDDASAVRDAFVAALEARARGDLPERGPRGGKRWSARFGFRRSAWHALDHAWEIQDRMR